MSSMNKFALLRDGDSDEEVPPPIAVETSKRPPAPQRAAVSSGPLAEGYTESKPRSSRGAPRAGVSNKEQQPQQPRRNKPAGAAGGGERKPRGRAMDRHSGTGRGKEVAKSGSGKASWGNPRDLDNTLKHHTAKEALQELANAGEVSGEKSQEKPAEATEDASGEGSSEEPEEEYIDLSTYLAQKAQVTAKFEIKPAEVESSYNPDAVIDKKTYEGPPAEYDFGGYHKAQKGRSKAKKANNVSADLLSFGTAPRDGGRDGGRGGGRGGGARGGGRGGGRGGAGRSEDRDREDRPRPPRRDREGGEGSSRGAGAPGPARGAAAGGRGGRGGGRGGAPQGGGAPRRGGAQGGGGAPRAFKLQEQDFPVPGQA